MTPLSCTPLSSGEEGSQKKALPEGLSPERAPQLTPTLAASSGFPNRSQVWARCPGRKWGAGPRGGQHSRPCCPRTSTSGRAQAASQQLGGGRSHPRSSQVSLAQKPHSGGLPPEPDPLPLLLETWSPLDGSHSVSTSAPSLSTPPPLAGRGGKKGRKCSGQGSWPHTMPSWGKNGVPCVVPRGSEKAGGGGPQPPSCNLGCPLPSRGLEVKHGKL